MKKLRLITLATSLLLAGRCAQATPTENIGFHLLPAPGKVTVDGKADDWDLSSGIFACDNVEEQRDTYGAWLHGMYDADNLYILAHFIDPTPLDNPGQVGADYGFQGDCLQFRLITRSPQENIVHVTAWKGRGGVDAVAFEFGQSARGRRIDNVKPMGAMQAFQKDEDGKGYVQEIGLPWKLITKDGQALHAGASLQLTFEPNFSVGKGGRLTVKDVFKAGVSLDRMFTFQNSGVWGTATLEATGHGAPRPERLADAREFPVRLEGGGPVVDWTGLIKENVAPGFKPIRFTTPDDGYVSLNIKNAAGEIVCQLLRGFAYAKGEHEVKWDGLTTPNGSVLGEPVPPGAYTWSALFHQKIGLELRGWAANSGSAPWDNGSSSNWGGDEGVPTSCASDSEHIYLGWAGAEAGNSLVATDLQGNVLWKNRRAGLSGVKGMASDGGIVYVLGGAMGVPSNGGNIYTLDAKTGDYVMPTGYPDIYVRGLWPDPKGKSETADYIAANGGKIYLSFTKNDTIMVVDGKTHGFVRAIAVPSPGSLAVAGDTIFAISAGKSVVKVGTGGGEVKTVVDGLNNAVALALDPQNGGRLYVGERDPNNRFKVFGTDGKLLGALGRQATRAASGPWAPEAMAFINGATLDANGMLWVAEYDERPKRFVVWNTKTSQLWKEFFGPADYGATGGAIDPLDPNIMVGQGCEWRLDPATGHASLLGVVTDKGQMFVPRNVTQQGLGGARFAVGANGKLYLALSQTFNRQCPVWIFERIGDGNYKLRASFDYATTTRQPIIWADENGDEQVQENEVTHVTKATLFFGGWYVGLAPDLTFYAGNGDRRTPHFYQIKVAGFTACGAPKYDFSKPAPLTGGSGLGSSDGKRVLIDGGSEHGWFHCLDAASGNSLWTFPDTFVGVHASHNAPPPQPGMIEGAYGIVGTATLPTPVGSIWAVGTNVGEWHLLTADGFYLTRLFQPDALKVTWPAAAVPGADMSNCPPGAGGEDFGGSMTQTKDGKIYIQGGKTAYWNMEVTGLETIAALTGGGVQINDGDVKLAQASHDERLQAAVGTKRLAVRKLSPSFTGVLDLDFKGADVVSYQKGDESRTRTAIAHDDKNLYLAWEVQDATPWVNGATAPEFMYVSGDTVDFQIGTDSKAKSQRPVPVLGDLRLSIGNLKGAPTAVIYRKVATSKHPKSFSSGIVRSYGMDSVLVATDVVTKVTTTARNYVVEATVPLATLGLEGAAGLKLNGDFGVTFGDPAGQRTRLRNYWSNQGTGIVDDAVYELMMQPKNWGEFTFVP